MRRRRELLVFAAFAVLTSVTAVTGAVTSQAVLSAQVTVGGNTFTTGTWGGPRYLRPNGDATSQFYSSNTGATTNLYTFINETVANDVTYIQNSTGNGGTGRIYEAALTDLSAPGVKTGHIIRFRARYTSNVANSLRVDLYQGATLIATGWNAAVSGTAFTTYTYTLTVPQATAITDYTALTIRFTPTNNALAGSRMRVSWVEMEIP